MGNDEPSVMQKIVSLSKRRGFIFQSSEIYGGMNGCWDYGPLGVELKRNVKECWWSDMVTRHDDLAILPGANEPFEMTGLDCTILMHPQVWKVSGHYDLFHDMMIDCRQTKRRYRHDQVRGRWAEAKGAKIFVTAIADPEEEDEILTARAQKFFGLRAKERDQIQWDGPIISLEQIDDFSQVLGPDAKEAATLTEPREFNLMFKTNVGAVQSDDSVAYLRPETAQGIFLNFKNVVDSSRVKIPFGIAQIGKSFRNEITPRNFTFRVREFEQMEIEFFCHPDSSGQWYQYWRDRRLQWYKDLGLHGDHLRLREHGSDELSHYSSGTADIEYSFPFLPEGEFGELEGVAHRGDFDLRSHIEGKLDPSTNPLEVQTGDDGKPLWKGSGKDLSYRDPVTNERFIPHVIEPSAGADRATLAFLCEAYTEDMAPDDKGEMQGRVVLRFHPRLAPIKAAVLPLVKKDGMPEFARDIYQELKREFPVFYDLKGAVGRRYRRMDEAGTPYCITIDGQSLQDETVTIRERDTMKQSRMSISEATQLIREAIQT